MESREDTGTIRTWFDLEPEVEPDNEPRYAVTAVAARVGIHVQTIRRYEQYGLVEPQRSGPTTILYSEADIEHLRRIRRLTNDLGINLAGVAAILQLRRQLVSLQRGLVSMQQQRSGGS